MANRSTRFQLKHNSTITGSTLPSSGILIGEPLVNLYDGILYFSGAPGSTGYTTGNTNVGYFEVGSHLTNLKLDGRIQRYDGQDGAGLVGQFLSGTTDGFVLAPISSISGTDTYVTGFTYDDANTITLSQNNGQPDYTVTLNQFTGLTINGNLSVTGDTNTDNIYVITSAITNNLSITGTGYYNTTATGSSPYELVNYDSLTAYTQLNDVFVTGGTSTGSTTGSSDATIDLTYSNGVFSGLYSLDYKDTYSTGGTFDNITSLITVGKNDGTTYTLDMGGATGLPVTDDRTINVDPIQNWIQLSDTVLAPYSGGPRTFVGDIQISGGTLYVLSGLSITGTSYYDETVSGSLPKEIVNVEYLTGFSQTNDVYVTGNTITSATTTDNTQTLNLDYHGTPIGGPYTLTAKDTFTTGGTYSAGTITFTKNDSTTYQVTGIDGTDTYVTGFTYNPSNNTLTISQNEGEPDLTAYIDSVSGLTINGDLTVTGNTTTGTISASTYNTNLTPGKVVYVGPSGELKVENQFGYDESGNTLTVDNIEVSQNVTISGDLTVLGSAISAFTTNLYVEDPNITLNYNPTGNTTSTSVNSGFVIQDGNGLNGGDVNFDIVRMQNLSGVTVGEYTSDTGYTNRGWITQLNDIVIRSTDTEDNGSAGSITGVRVLTEFDVLDSGEY